MEYTRYGCLPQQALRLVCRRMRRLNKLSRVSQLTNSLAGCRRLHRANPTSVLGLLGHRAVCLDVRLIRASMTIASVEAYSMPSETLRTHAAETTLPQQLE